jgi:hypothetical protein
MINSIIATSKTSIMHTRITFLLIMGLRIVLIPIPVATIAIANSVEQVN